MTAPAPSFYAVAHFLRRHLPARRAQAIKGFAHWLFGTGAMRAWASCTRVGRSSP